MADADAGRPGASPSRVQEDFDRIALLSKGRGWDPNAHYHTRLLAALPSRVEESLDLGCGYGDFTRLLAVRSERVLGVDLSPNMIRLAKERSADHTNVTFLETDATTWAWPRARFGVVASIATLHHLPFEETLLKMRDALAPGGTLVVLDLFHWEGPAGFVMAGAAVPASWWMKWRAGSGRPDPELVAAWAEHGKVDRYMTLRQLRAVCARVLPGAVVRRHLFWRYSLVWRKPV